MLHQIVLRVEHLSDYNLHDADDVPLITKQNEPEVHYLQFEFYTGEFQANKFNFLKGVLKQAWSNPEIDMQFTLTDIDYVLEGNMPFAPMKESEE